MIVSFDLQPTLVGHHVALRPLRAGDHDLLCAVASDPLIWEQHPAKERATPEGFRRFFDEAMASGGALLATDPSTGETIGSSRFASYDPTVCEVEIGWTFLARSRWGGTVNGEMKRLMLTHAFQFVEHVILVIDARNWRSRRAAEKVGAALVPGRVTPSSPNSVVYRIDC